MPTAPWCWSKATLRPGKRKNGGPEWNDDYVNVPRGADLRATPGDMYRVRVVDTTREQIDLNAIAYRCKKIEAWWGPVIRTSVFGKDVVALPPNYR